MTREEFENELPGIDEDIKKIVNHHFWEREEREDAYQMVLLNLVKSYHTFDTSHNIPFSHWVCKIASLRCKEKVRQIVTRRKYLKLISMTPKEGEGQTMFEPPSTDGPIEDGIAKREKFVIVNKALQQLNNTDRLILKLYSYYLMDKEIIEVMELNHSSERMRQKRERALHNLKSILTTKYYFNENDL